MVFKEGRSEEDVQRIVNRNWKEFYEEIVLEIEAEVKSNFDMEQDAFGSGWTPLAESTIEWRLRYGYGESPILVNTGNLRDSIEVVADPTYPGSAEVESNVEYAEAVHQNRPFLDIPEKFLNFDKLMDSDKGQRIQSKIDDEIMELYE